MEFDGEIFNDFCWEVEDFEEEIKKFEKFYLVDEFIETDFVNDSCWEVEDFEEEIEKFEKFYLVDETHCVDKSCREFDCVDDEFRELEQNFSVISTTPKDIFTPPKSKLILSIFQAPYTELKPPPKHLAKAYTLSAKISKLKKIQNADVAINVDDVAVNYDDVAVHSADVAECAELIILSEFKGKIDCFVEFMGIINLNQINSTLALNLLEMACFNCFILALFAALMFSGIDVDLAARRLQQLPPLPKTGMPPLPQPKIPIVLKPGSLPHTILKQTQHNHLPDRYHVSPNCPPKYYRF
ncbi:hypothetical protein GQ457_16G009160 [Hibiscus cannabinus]